MPATVSDLLASPRLGLELLTPPATPVRPATPGLTAPLLWSHSSDLDDPSPFLEPGQLLLTTGRQFSPSYDYGSYVARLGAAGVVALGFGTEVVRTTPPALVEACERVGLPLVEVPYATPFIAVSRFIADRLAAEAREQLEWTLDAQDALSRAASSSGGLAAVVDRASVVLGSGVGVFDADGGVVEQSGGLGTTPSAREFARQRVAELLARGQRAHDGGTRGGTNWSVRTLGRAGRLLGAVFVEREQPFSAADESVLSMLSALAGLSFEHAEDQRIGLRSILEQFLRLLRDGRVASVRRGLASLPMGLPREPVTVIAVNLAEVRSGIRDSLERLAARSPRRLFVAGDGGQLLVLCDSSSLEGVVQLLSSSPLRAGRSDPGAWNQIESAITQSLRALDSAPAGRLLSFEQLVAENVFGLLASSQVADIARSRLRTQLDSEAGRRRLREAAVWLRHNGSWEPAARELGMHRHSLKARVAELSAQLALPLDTFQGRAELWVLLAAADLVPSAQHGSARSSPADPGPS